MNSTLYLIITILCFIYSRPKIINVNPFEKSYIKKSSKEVKRMSYKYKRLQKNTYSKFAVTTELPIASEIGLDVLKAGGSAVDAAIASSLAIGVVNSFSSGLGGGGFVLVRNMGKSYTLDFRESAPRQTKMTDFTNPALKGKYVGIPGEVRGLKKLHDMYGVLPWSELFKKPIELCKSFSVTEQLERRLKKHEKSIMKDAGLRKTYTRNGALVKKGDIISRPALLETFIKISKDPNSFYTGSIAYSMVKSINEHGGSVDMSDFEKYQVIERPALESKFHDYKAITTNLPSGGIFLIQALNILEHFNVKYLRDISIRDGKFTHYHLLIEVFKFMNADRGELTDPEFLPNWKSKVKKLISKKRASDIAQKINLNGVLNYKEYKIKEGATKDSGTTHINVIDKNGMIVSLTTSVNLEFGAKFMDPNTGIIFNDVVSDFYLPNISHPFNTENTFANKVEPYKRPLSSISPLIIEKEDEVLILGAAGGSRIPTSIIAVIFHMLGGRVLSEAIPHHRLHNQLSPHITYVENNLPDKIINFLESLGHKIKRSDLNSIFTSVQGIHIKKGGGKMIIAFADERKGGMSAGI